MNNRTSGMSDWHRAWQSRFHTASREQPFFSGGYGRRADVSLGHLAVEFQHSSISEDEWRRRTDFYITHCDMAVLWVYDRTARVPEADLAGADLKFREFYRNLAAFGPDWPLALDYGGHVVLAWDFNILPSWDMFLPRRAVFMQHGDFAEFLSGLGAYPTRLLFESDFQDLLAGFGRYVPVVGVSSRTTDENFSVAPP